MSATDSDNSIDWLASDTEENESEQEPDCTAKRSQREAPLSESSSELSEDNWCEVSGSRGSPGGTARSDRDSSNGLCKSQRGEKVNGKNTQPVKRPHSSTGELCKERQLISNAFEKDQVFINKVSTPATVLFYFSLEVVDNVNKTRTCPITQIHPHTNTHSPLLLLLTFPVRLSLLCNCIRGVCRFGLRELCLLIIKQAQRVSYLTCATQYAFQMF